MLNLETYVKIFYEFCDKGVKIYITQGLVILCILFLEVFKIIKFENILELISPSLSKFHKFYKSVIGKIIKVSLSFL